MQPVGHEMTPGKTDNHSDKIVIADVRELDDRLLTDYLVSRSISQEVAIRYCREVEFCLNNRNHIAVGFPNNSGGFELRNEHFKGSSSPKDFTFIGSDAESLTVFEGFFDFLSYKMLNQNKNGLETSFLILNSLSFFNKSLPIMEKHQKVNLYLDRDPSGIKLTAEALHLNPSRYIDKSFLYQNRKDLNEWLKTKEQVKRGHAFKRTL
ncbi:toprim domain-containing protein [Flavobacterium anhuiense]|uniref:toprim domain-containing protein n=1 Tax=Flavobacterium anhuiense TaxID=459526 RepID=UPI003D99C78A